MAPLRGLLGIGGGLNNNKGGAALGPTSPTDYPLTAGQYAVYSSDWPGNPANLPVSDAPTTFTVPSAARGYIRVVAVGSSPGSAIANVGAGARVDALIPVNNGDRFKAIVGGGGGTANCGTGCNSPDTRGGNGVGGGCGVDSNDSGSGGGGTGFFYAEPGATSDPAMFPKGVVIAGAGGGGNGAVPAGSAPSTFPDAIGGFTGIFRGGSTGPVIGEPGVLGGLGGRVRNNGNTLVGSQTARGSGGVQQSEGYPGCNAGTGGGAGGGGYGGDCSPGTSPNTAEPAPSGRGLGYTSFNEAGAGLGGGYPMRGGNGFSFQGVNLGGGSGGSHGRAHAGGGWGGGGGAYYDMSGGAGGSGAWGYVPGTATINDWTPSASIPVNGGNINSVMGVPTSLGNANGAPGYIVVMW